ncbi:MAG: DUF192 domain-containing protein [Treponema sp.]|jgi:uncharacterized membrane protein (UPF0127 family)|nr:DUF192 domain-containing protein [Treponema sp.]
MVFKRGKPRAGGGLRRGWIWTASFAVIFSLADCAAKPAKSPAIITDFKTRELTIERAAAPPVRVKAELALSEEEQSQGLMYRESLDDGQGMLFVFDRDKLASFWMKNTFIPLSIAYISSDGSILEIYDMRPEDLSLIRSSRSVRYALEVPQGWFSRAGIGPGDRLLIESF